MWILAEISLIGDRSRPISSLSIQCSIDTRCSHIRPFEAVDRSTYSIEVDDVCKIASGSNDFVSVNAN
ncbi:hypothetical protein BLOT_006083 [Blomia tropicalis]|nr:hypothetical protein BLOT_006083 [Blomia tropicalis]